MSGGSLWDSRDIQGRNELRPYIRLVFALVSIDAGTDTYTELVEVCSALVRIKKGEICIALRYGVLVVGARLIAPSVTLVFVASLMLVAVVHPSTESARNDHHWRHQERSLRA